MITIENLTMQFGKEPLFENISAKFGKNNRYGLIGANGCGKSTLMKILGSEQNATSGNIIIDRSLRIGKLCQDQFSFEEYTVLDTVIMGHTELWKVKAEREKLYALENMSEAEALKVAELEIEFGEMGGYSAESQAGELLLGLGIALEQHQRLMQEIAPGLKLRILLAQALFATPDILLLDEPTNNLDINTIRWLENIINASKGLMVIISHDRHFLNSVCTHIADIDYGTLRIYPGNYDDYMIASSQAKARLLADNSKKKAQIEELRTFISRFSANASKSKQATSRARKIEKIELEDIKPSSRVHPYIKFLQKKQLYRLVLAVKKLTKKFAPDTIFSNLNFSFEAGERIAIIGDNGVGKTTLLRCLVNDLESDGGVIKWSENAALGYFAQDSTADFATEQTLFDWMSQWKKAGDDEQVVFGVLGQLLFSGDEAQKLVTVTSGGERGRLLFGKLILQQNNVLIMDEPTNHLDMESIESLNFALERYSGTLIFVSHDRAFVSSLATRIIKLTPQGIFDFKGSYDEYLHNQGIEKAS